MIRLVSYLWLWFQSVKEESEKVGLKLNIQKTKIMVSSPITSWQIDDETVEIVVDFILGASSLFPSFPRQPANKACRQRQVV